MEVEIYNNVKRKSIETSSLTSFNSEHLIVTIIALVGLIGALYVMQYDSSWMSQTAKTESNRNIMTGE